MRIPPLEDGSLKFPEGPQLSAVDYVHKTAAPVVTLNEENSYTVPNTGGTYPLTLDVSGITAGKGLTWTINSSGDQGMLTLPATTGTVNVDSNTVSLGDFTVSANSTPGSEARSATVTITFTCDTTDTYAAAPAPITVTFSQEAGPAVTASLSVSATNGSWDALTYGYDSAKTVTYTITNTGNVALENVSVSLSPDSAFTAGTLSPTTIEVGGTATVTVTFPTGQSAGEYTDTLTVTADGGAQATAALPQTVQPKGITVV